jgi:transcription-repair coupling factor (superfamily II helicase)
MHEFEAAFPYQETVDQVRVIAEVKKDMAATKPMDRLICGDAGYGKTEIAMRAAFIAVMNGRQVAILVPTTVLAEQHFETFSDRMNAYPVRIDVVSRFQPYTRRKKILAAAAEGQIDILIGTHALLGEGVSFKDLGLLIIDEEQRFGVAHKERLKHLRQVVDVLTLSATPIPRTLYMSMTGARDLSLLQTPPRERLAVETKVARDNDSVIRTAIKQELNRNGQVYFLYNRVMSIGLMQRRLEALVPEARIALAHGQMPSGELAAVMHAFEAGEVDVLLCTTLVESGLDIPRANTILVHRADRFGIADLYQLRGRVGRSSQKGYAWLLLPEYGHIDEDSRQRIAALQKHSGLGAGFNLALRDLEIRGAGNLLGATQSGHIAAIGFGLYCQLLRRTIARLKGEQPPLLVDVDLSLDFLDYSPIITSRRRDSGCCSIVASQKPSPSKRLRSYAKSWRTVTGNPRHRSSGSCASPSCASLPRSRRSDASRPARARSIFIRQVVETPSRFNTIFRFSREIPPKKRSPASSRASSTSAVSPPPVAGAVAVGSSSWQ